jgi:isopentenyl phosphate kinase
MTSLVLAALEGVADQIRNAPEEADDFAVIHGTGSLSQADLKVRLYAFATIAML